MDIWSILNVNILHKIMFWNKRVIHCSNCMLMTKFNGWIGSTSATPLLYIYYYYNYRCKVRVVSLLCNIGDNKCVHGAMHKKNSRIISDLLQTIFGSCLFCVLFVGADSSANVIINNIIIINRTL